MSSSDELRVAEAEDKAEMAFRKSTAKATEGEVKAVVGSDSKVLELRNQLLDAREAAREGKLTLQIELLKVRKAKLEANDKEEIDVSPDNGKLYSLREKLEATEDALNFADVEVEVIQTTVETYKMLVKLSASLT